MKAVVRCILKGVHPAGSQWARECPDRDEVRAARAARARAASCGRWSVYKVAPSIRPTG
jgi:hypothetical protein